MKTLSSLIAAAAVLAMIIAVEAAPNTTNHWQLNVWATLDGVPTNAAITFNGIVNGSFTNLAIPYTSATITGSMGRVTLTSVNMAQLGVVYPNNLTNTYWSPAVTYPAVPFPIAPALTAAVLQSNNTLFVSFVDQQPIGTDNAYNIYTNDTFCMSVTAVGQAQNSATIPVAPGTTSMKVAVDAQNDAGESSLSQPMVAQQIVNVAPRIIGSGRTLVP